MDISSAKLNDLIAEIEKVRRRKIANALSGDNIQYFDPLDNLNKIKTPNNHLILGRRGSGKTTLLLSTIKSGSNDFIFPIDCQIYRKDNRVDIALKLMESLLESLINQYDTFEDFKNQKKDYYHFRRTKNLYAFCKFWQKQVIHKYEEYVLCRTAMKELLYCIKELQNFPNEPIKINTNFNVKSSIQTQVYNQEEIKLKTELLAKGNVKNLYSSLEGSVNVIANITNQISNKQTHEQTTEEKAMYEKVVSKQEKTDELKKPLAQLFFEFSKLSGKRIVYYLDDFYLIPLINQPYIIQYLHDIYKNAQQDAFSFKICSIPNRTRLNEEGSVDFSIKDDFSPIKLDKELYDFSNLKEFLLLITSNLRPDLEISSADINSLFNNTDVLDYTVVATGGVPRDFLVILADLIRIARAKHSDTIKKQHLYSAVADMKEDKENNIEVESDMDPSILRKALVVIEEEIVQKMKTNVILYPAADAKKHEELLKNLVNLRYLHVINESTSSEKIKNENFISYLIDMTFYATSTRLKQGFEFRPFWEKDTDHRHTHLRNAPIWKFDLSKIGL